MIDKIHTLCDELKLRHTRATIADALRHAQRRKPSYSTFLLQILRQELEEKRNRTIANRIKRSGLKEFWTLETYPWHIQTCLRRQRRTIEELAELDFIDQGRSIVFVGIPGCGKSGLASGILMKAFYAGRTSHAITAQDLFDDLSTSQADRSTKALVKRLSSVDLLLINEFGYLSAPTPVQINQFFRVMDNRANRKSCIVTTNLGFNEWGKFLGNKSMTAALTSRLLQTCVTIDFPVDAVNLRNPKYKLPTKAPLPEILKDL